MFREYKGKRARLQQPTKVTSSLSFILTLISESRPPRHSSSAVHSSGFFIFLVTFLASPTKANCVFLLLIGSHHKPHISCFVVASLYSLPVAY